MSFALQTAVLARADLIAAQKRICAETGHPHFVPHTGICWKCKADMVDESWGRVPQTGCRPCGKSYCD